MLEVTLRMMREKAMPARTQMAVYMTLGLFEGLMIMGSRVFWLSQDSFGSRPSSAALSRVHAMVILKSDSCLERLVHSDLCGLLLMRMRTRKVKLGLKY